MSRWGKLPWHNDTAADWYGALFDRTQIAKLVEETLRLDATDCPDEIRAAASLLLFLGRVYIWPIDDLDRHLTLAAGRLEEISRSDVILDSAELTHEVRTEIEELRSRIMKPGASEPPPEPRVCW